MATAVIDELVAASSDIVHAKCSAGGTALHWCASCCDAATAAAAIKGLLAAGINPRSKDSDGDEAIHWAAQSNESREAAAAAVAALLEAGADAHAPNSQGKPPLALVLERQGAAQCAHLLRVLVAGGSGGSGGNRSGSKAAAGASQDDGSAAGPGSAAHAAHDAAASSGAAGEAHLLQLAAVGVSQLFQRKRKRPPADEQLAPECPVCMDAPPCMAASCGHVYCASCAEKPEVLQQCPVCRKRPERPMLRIFF